MTQIEQLLRYQQKDAELIAIEQEIANSEERKKYVQTKNFMKKASEKLDQLEAKSQEILAQLDRLNKRYEEIAETLKDFEHLDELVEGGADLFFYQRNATQIAESLKALKVEINALIAEAKDTTNEYQTLKKKVIATQKQYPEISTVYQEYKKTKQDAAGAISKELEEIAKKLDPEVLRKYNTKRSERIFPILCEIKADRCSKCGMELSIAGKETVSQGKVVECENCHRFLYKI